MCQATFMDIIAQMGPHIVCQGIGIWSHFTLEKQVAITIMKLLNPSSYCWVTSQFNMGRIMTGEDIQEVSLITKGILANRFIHLINPLEEVTGFFCIGFLNSVRTIGGTHIPLAQATQEFINCKGYFSTVLKGVVDHWTTSPTSLPTGQAVPMIHRFIDWEINPACSDASNEMRRKKNGSVPLFCDSIISLKLRRARLKYLES
ncbi:hypothetical protein Y1Q_0017211 [Alligator mississippiensis]|uniref:Uncharacterized protein n=1 Tax=Alligator mississippiensis TaxID=8496 RepID=A0A151NKR7_ALLMI|nr:hypothetical protein Y1Q_0017211 [Alligator mississippiensis]